MTTYEDAGPMQRHIYDLMSKEFEPEHIEVINESYMHNVPRGSETHFKLVIVSDKFDGVPRIQRHRKVNGLLKEEMNKGINGGIHALSVIAKLPTEWDGQPVDPSPSCLGGGKHDLKKQ
eukprot:Clim_evm11s204 gene=Clim_evmTU11s204